MVFVTNNNNNSSHSSNSRNDSIPMRHSLRSNTFILHSDNSLESEVHDSMYVYYSMKPRENKQK